MRGKVAYPAVFILCKHFTGYGLQETLLTTATSFSLFRPPRQYGGDDTEANNLVPNPIDRKKQAKEKKTRELGEKKS